MGLGQAGKEGARASDADAGADAGADADADAGADADARVSVNYLLLPLLVQAGFVAPEFLGN